MNYLTKKIFLFIKTNPSIIYSLILFILVPVVIILNTLYILDKFQKNIDTITHSKAILAENIINAVLPEQEILSDTAALEKIIDRVQTENDDVKHFEFLVRDQATESFQILASDDKARQGNDSKELPLVLAWNQEEAIAHLEPIELGRAWRVVKLLKNEAGEKVGLVALSLSLKESDALVDATIVRAYFVLIATILLVAFLTVNNARIFGYALTVSKLKEVDKMKDEFISIASHELRTPLTAILGYMELFNDKNKHKLDDESQRYLANISTSVERLQMLVNDILEISRLESGRLSFEIKPMDPSPVVAETIEEMRSAAVGKGLSLEYIPAPLPQVKADRDRLKQVLINLIGNSIKYTPQGKVSVSSDVTGKQLLITIADTGIGISSEDQANLFQKFYRVQNMETKNIIGTGLGLWLTREITRRMNGDITIESIKGVGSHFTIHLPLA